MYNVSDLEVLTGIKHKLRKEMAEKSIYGPLDEYIATLSEEERMQYGELIEECKERDRRIVANAEARKHSLQRLSELEKQILQALTELDSASQRLLQHTAEAYLKKLDSKQMKAN